MSSKQSLRDLTSSASTEQSSGDKTVGRLDPPKLQNSGDVDVKKSPNSKRRKSPKKSPLSKKKMNGKAGGSEPTQHPVAASLSDVTPITSSSDEKIPGRPPQTTGKFESFFLSKKTAAPATNQKAPLQGVGGSGELVRSDSTGKSSTTSESVTREKVMPNTAAKLPPIATDTPSEVATPTRTNSKAESEVGEGSVASQRSGSDKSPANTDGNLLAWAMKGDWNVVDQHMRNTSREKLEKVVSYQDPVSHALDIPSTMGIISNGLKDKFLKIRSPMYM